MVSRRATAHRRTAILAARCTLVLTAFLAGCDESLPPREEPPEALRAGLHPIEGIVVVRNGVITSQAGAFEASLHNTYSEVLQGPARIGGTVTVRLRADRSKAATVALGREHLLTDWIVRFMTVTLGVDSSAVFYRQWSHRTDSGRYYWEFVRLTNKISPRGEEYRESDPVHLSAVGSLQILDQIQRRRTVEVPFTLVYQLWP